MLDIYIYIYIYIYTHPHIHTHTHTSTHTHTHTHTHTYIYIYIYIYICECEYACVLLKMFVKTIFVLILFYQFIFKLCFTFNEFLEGIEVSGSYECSILWGSMKKISLKHYQTVTQIISSIVSIFLIVYDYQTQPIDKQS